MNLSHHLKITSLESPLSPLCLCLLSWRFSGFIIIFLSNVVTNSHPEGSLWYRFAADPLRALRCKILQNTFSSLSCSSDHSWSWKKPLPLLGCYHHLGVFLHIRLRSIWRPGPMGFPAEHHSPPLACVFPTVHPGTVTFSIALRSLRQSLTAVASLFIMFILPGK